MSSAQVCRRCSRSIPVEDNFCAYCGAAQATPTAHGVPAPRDVWLEILDTLREVALPKYEVQSLLGHGGMAGVYLAFESKLGRDVAIKVMAPNLMVDSSLVSRFVQEARTTAQLDHPNIVTIFDVENDERIFFFVMTYVPGRTLGEVMKSEGPLPVPALATWLTHVAGALDYAHQRGVVHRDIKPGNILLDNQGKAMVTDFGIAKVALEPNLTRTGMLVGTPAYMSPEQWLSGDITPASDQYSLGCVAYHMITGRRPYTGADMLVMQSHLNEAVAPILDLRPDCPPEIVAAVERMLEKKPEDRWSHISDVLDTLTGFVPSRRDPAMERVIELGLRVSDLTIEPPPDPVVAGEPVPMAVTTHDTRGQVLSNREVAWQSSEPSVVEVMEEGTLRAVRAGSVRLTAVCEGVARSLQLEVRPPAVVELRVEGPASLTVGDEGALIAIPLAADGTEVDDQSVKWASSDERVATVSEEGRVQAMGPGSVTITAEVEGASTPVTLAVAPAQAAKVSLEAPSSLVVGDQAVMVCRTWSARGDQLEGRTVTWATSDSAVVDISRDGTITARGPGKATVTASCDGVTSTVEIDVPAPFSAAPPVGATQLFSPDSVPTEEAEPSQDVAAPTPAHPIREAGPPEPAPAEAEPVGATAGSATTEKGERSPWAARVLGGVGVVGVAVAVAMFGPWGSGSPPTESPPPVVVNPAGAFGDSTEFPAEGVDPATSEEEAVAGELDSVATQVEQPSPLEANSDAPPTDPVELTTEQPSLAPEPEQEDPLPPTEGVIRVVGSLPPGSEVRVTGPGAQNLLMDGDSIILAPGSYNLRFTADGFLPDSEQILVRAGASQSWRPQLLTEPEPEPEEVQPPEPPPVDEAAVFAAITDVVERLVASVQTRQVETTLRDFPASSSWVGAPPLGPMLLSSSVRNVELRLQPFTQAEIDRDRAEAYFTVLLSAQSGNISFETTYRLHGVFTGSGSDWQLTELRVVSSEGG